MGSHTYICVDDESLKTACELSRMFESLLNLVPNNHYFTEDTQDESTQKHDESITISQQKRKLKFDRYSLDALRPTLAVAQSKTIHNKKIRRAAAEKEKIIPNNELVSRNELKARLHAKIEKLRAAKNADTHPHTHTHTQKRRKQTDKEKHTDTHTHTEENTHTHTHKDTHTHTPRLVTDRNKEAVSSSTFQFGQVEASTKIADMPSNILFKNKAGDKKRKLETAISDLKEKRQQLQTLTPQQKQDKETEMAYDRAMQKIQGVKVKSDMAKLKKTKKRHEKKKAKSQTEWNKRLQQLNNDKDSRQTKRKENINKRKQQRKSK